MVLPGDELRVVSMSRKALLTVLVLAALTLAGIAVTFWRLTAHREVTERVEARQARPDPSR